jgi:hypothetical protein
MIAVQLAEEPRDPLIPASTNVMPTSRQIKCSWFCTQMRAIPNKTANSYIIEITI